MCTKPLKGFPYGLTKNGKTNYIICSSDVHHVELGSLDEVYKSVSPLVTQGLRAIFEYIEIPCGQCIECKLEYSRQWANRCVLEASEHKDNCFITLTYDDNNIPTNKVYRSDTGEETIVKTLEKSHLQLFMKRLRKELSKHGLKIRFFACGEYGSETKRPHYHIIIFGWKPDDSDLSLYNVSPLGDKLYNSELLSRLWTYGHSIVAECTWESCAYVARYVAKKQFIESDLYDLNGIQKEFVTMSRRPGIGLNWYLKNTKNYKEFQNNYIGTEYGSRKISHNRYFDSYLEKEDPEAYQKLKDVRKKFAKNKKQLLIKNSDLSYMDQLEIKGRNVEKKTKILKGSVI